MRCDSLNGNTSKKFAVGFLLMCLASAAGAVTLVGGGATLPTIAYTGQAGLPVTALTPAAGSLFGVYLSHHSGTAVTYCPTGTGAGTKIFAGNDPLNFQVNAACGLTSIWGFGGNGLLHPHFAASEAPLSVSEYNAYIAGHGAGTQPTQLPAIAGAVAILFKKTGVNALTLSEDQICGIFSGQITDWSAISPASGPINIVYHRGGSGTSFAFLNHLSAVCPAVAHTATQFKTLQTYATGVAFNDSTGLPTSYIARYASSYPLDGVYGDAAAAAAVGGTLPGSVADGSIGYAEVANGILAGVKAASVTNVAGRTVNPITAFGPTAVAVVPVFDQLLSDNVDFNGRPVLVSAPATSNGCLALVDPSSYANPALAGSNSTAYPIIAISNLLGNAQGNGTDTAAVRGVLSSPYDVTIRPSVTRIGRVGTGYAWLSSQDLTTVRVDSCIN